MQRNFRTQMILKAGMKNLFCLCAALCFHLSATSTPAINVNEPPDHAREMPGSNHVLDAAVNTFSGTLDTTNQRDLQDHFQITCPPRKIITQVTKTVTGNGFVGFVSFNTEALVGQGGGTFTGAGTTATYPLGAGTYQVLAAADFAPAAAWTITVHMEDAPDYELFLSGGFLSVIDMSGNGDAMTISQPTTGTILFTVPGRTFSLNKGPKTIGATNPISLSGLKDISIHGMSGNDSFIVGNLAAIPSLAIRGGQGNDTVILNGDVTLAPDEGLDVNFQADSEPGSIEVLSVSAGAGIVASGTGGIVLKSPQGIRLAQGASVETQNGQLKIEANQQTALAAGDFSGVEMDGAELRVTGTGSLSVKGTPALGSAANRCGLVLANASRISGTNVELSALRVSPGNTGLSLLTGSEILAAAATIVTDRLKADNTVRISATSVLTIKPAEFDAVTVNLGGLPLPGVAQSLDLSDALLDRIVTTLLELPSGAAGCEFSAAISPSAVGTLKLINASGAALRPPIAGVDVTMPPGGRLDLAMPLQIDITGPVPDTQAPQLKVIGGVNLLGALKLTSTYAGSSDDTFTLIDNDGTDPVSGAFTGLFDGAFVPWPGSPGLLGAISYFGGPGNDVVLRLISPDAGFLRVTNAQAEGPGSLRSAFSYAAASPGPDTIVIEPWLSGQTIMLGGEIIVPAGTAVTADVTALPQGLTVSGGGGSRLFSNADSLTLRGFTLTGGAGAPGGAISNESGATLNLQHCTLFGNASAGNGGAIANGIAATANLTRCTLSGNAASGDGGAIYNPAGTATLTHVTVSSNSAVRGGGIYEGVVTLNNSIVAGNSSNLGGDVFSEFLAGTFYLTDTDPRLGPLANNGGATMTRALLSGSPALNAAGAGALTDQRGFAIFGLPDLGAYEEQPWIGITGSRQYDENFNSLGTASRAWTDHTRLTGWRAQINNGATAPGNLQASNGSTVLSGLINAGSTDAQQFDRALGSRANPTGNTANISYAVTFRNVAAVPVSFSRLRYVIELWRSGTAASQVENVTVFYAITDSPPAGIASGSSSSVAAPGTGFTAMPSAANTFVAVAAANAALNGNSAANRSLADFSFSAGAAPVILAGQYLTLKWTDTDTPGGDGIQAIDDVSITFTEHAPPPLVLGSIANGNTVSPLKAATNARFRQTGPSEITMDPGAAVLTTDVVPLVPGTEKCFVITVEAQDLSNTDGFEAADTLKVELLAFTPEGTVILSLTSDFDIDGDGVISGGASPLFDEFNTGQLAHSVRWTSAFPLVGIIPVGATGVQVRITAALSASGSVEVLRFRDAGIFPCLDSDSDGINDSVEGAQGTNPFDAASRQEFHCQVGGSTELSTVPGRNYQTLYSSELAHWTRDGAPASGAGQSIVLPPLSTTEARAFRKVLIAPVPTIQP